MILSRCDTNCGDPSNVCDGDCTSIATATLPDETTANFPPTPPKVAILVQTILALNAAAGSYRLVYCGGAFNSGGVNAWSPNGNTGVLHSGSAENFAGIWLLGTTYSSGQVVLANANSAIAGNSSALYRSLVDSNVGNDPTVPNSIFWTHETRASDFGGTLSGYSSEGAAVAAGRTAALEVDFCHTGGMILLVQSDAPASDNTNGTTNPSFALGRKGPFSLPALAVFAVTHNTGTNSWSATVTVFCNTLDQIKGLLCTLLPQFALTNPSPPQVFSSTAASMTFLFTYPKSNPGYCPQSIPLVLQISDGNTCGGFLDKAYTIQVNALSQVPILSILGFGVINRNDTLCNGVAGTAYSLVSFTVQNLGIETASGIVAIINTDQQDAITPCAVNWPASVSVSSLAHLNAVVVQFRVRTLKPGTAGIHLTITLTLCNGSITLPVYTSPAFSV